MEDEVAQEEETQSYAGRREGSEVLTFRGSGVSALRRLDDGIAPCQLASSSLQQACWRCAGALICGVCRVLGPLPAR